jgi:hypothetical protein
MAPTIHYNDITTLVTPAGTATLNASSGDTYWVVPSRSSGLGTARVRSPTDPKGQTDGLIVHPRLEEGQNLVLAGDLRIRSAVTESGTIAAQDSLASGLLTKLRSIKSTTGTLNFGNGAAITVNWEIICDFPPLEGIQKGFLFGLISASPPST